MKKPADQSLPVGADVTLSPKRVHGVAIVACVSSEENECLSLCVSSLFDYYLVCHAQLSLARRELCCLCRFISIVVCLCVLCGRVKIEEEGMRILIVGKRCLFGCLRPVFGVEWPVASVS